MDKIVKILLFSAAIIVLSACVTTNNSSLSSKANTEEAIEKYVTLGLEYIKRDDLNRARKHLLRALELDPENAPANAALGLIYHEEDEKDLAEEAFTTALDEDPGYTRGRTYYAAFLFSYGSYKKALEQFEIASKDTAYESRAQIFTNIALCHLKLGNEKQALTAYEKTIRLDRFNGRALSGITELLIKQEDFKRAQYYYNRLVKVISQQGLRHSAQSLWMGIRIADYYASEEQVLSLGGLLFELYPDSREYGEYLKLRNGS